MPYAYTSAYVISLMQPHQRSCVRQLPNKMVQDRVHPLAHENLRLAQRHLAAEQVIWLVFLEIYRGYVGVISHLIITINDGL